MTRALGCPSSSRSLHAALDVAPDGRRLHLLLITLAALVAISFVGHAVFFVGVGFRTLRTRVRPNSAARRNHQPATSHTPPVTILKPCAGADDDLDACLESYCRLNYPHVQIVFGVRDTTDAAYPVLRSVKARHPEADIKIVICASGRSASPKVANLEVMIREARHELVWLSDSNTRVHPDTLASMVDELHAEGVGLVASPIVGDGEQTLGSTLEAMQLCAFVNLAALAIVRFPGRLTIPGKSMLLRRAHLEAVGFDELGRYFGEDEILCDGVRRLGLKCILGRFTVVNVTRRSTLRKFLARHLRWSQIRWSTAPVFSNLYELIFSPMTPALALATLAPTRVHLVVLTAALAYQAVVDQTLTTWMRGRAIAWQAIPLFWIRPLLSAYLTLRAFVDRRVEWRGRQYWMGSRSAVLTEPPLRAWLRGLSGVER